MIGLLIDNINNGLLFIYGLIAVVVVLIIVIIVIDRKDNKKRKCKKCLSDTLSMKPLRDDEFENKDIEILNIISNKKDRLIDLKEVSRVEEPVKPEPKIEYIREEVRVETKEEPKYEYIHEEVYSEPVEEVLEEEEEYIEDDLEKTQAQIRVEEITKALEDAGVDEQIEHDKYAKFEEEQEKNAFISYDELKNNYDRLYEENEKTQYLEDNTIPINIKELYEAAKQEEANNNQVEIEDLEEEEMPVSFSPTDEPRRPVDSELRNASSFLTNLKELRDNLN